MINFDEEIKRFKPALELDQAEDSKYIHHGCHAGDDESCKGSREVKNTDWSGD